MLFTQRFGVRKVSWGAPKVMGVLNMTPDSFSDGGAYWKSSGVDSTAAYDRAQAMVAEGAIFIDVGGESTRPGASAVSVQQELDRVIPVIEKLAANADCIISIDTSSPCVMREAATAGAGLLNDVRAFQREGAVEVAAKTGLSICIMHMQGEPQTMQEQPVYESVAAQVHKFLLDRIKVCIDAGVDKKRIIVDPGFGFGKMLQHNLQLLNNLADVRIDGVPLLVGMSRKSMIGEVLDNDVDERLVGGIALAVMAVMKGASIVRTHDVAATSQALNMVMAVSSS